MEEEHDEDSCTVLAVTATCLALVTSAAPGGATAETTALPACGTAGMATCEKRTNAECIIKITDDWVIIRDDRCDWENEGCGPE